jgi:hypothetical protein
MGTGMGTGGMDPSERSQILIQIKNARVNYAKVIEKIDFRPYMLDLPPATSSSSSFSSSSSSSSSARMAIYLPDTHNVHIVFEKYIKLYKGVIGNPALVFVDRKAYSDYILYARDLIKKTNAPGAPTPPPNGPQNLVDDDKIRMINNNITFIVNLLFQKNRIIVTGSKNDQIQVIVADKPTIVSQSYYLDTYNKDEISYSSGSGSTTVKKYVSGDTIIVQKEAEASDLKIKIDDLKKERKDKEQDWIKAKDKYKKTPIAVNLTAVENARDEYNKALDKENEKVVERNKIVSEINQLRYGSKEVVSILERIERDSRPIEEKERNKIVLEKEIELLENKTKLIENTRAKISTDIIDELLDILETIFDVQHTEAASYKREVAVLEAKLKTKVNETKAEIDSLRNKLDDEIVDEEDNTTMQLLEMNQKEIEDYTTRMKSVEKLKKELEAIEGKNNKLVVGSFSQNPYPRDSLMYVRYEIKTKESEKKKVEEQLTELKYKQKREELKLENYTLRVYVYELKGVSLVSKYLSNGKKNQQFALLQSKGYGVRGTSEYQKNADKLMKDAPMFSAASCLQQKTEIQNMFDNIVLSTREKIKDALDNQQQVGGAGNGEGVGAESLQPASTKERIIQNYKKFSISELLLGPEKPYVSKQPPSKKCTGSIRERGDDTESKLLQSVNIKMGSYPPFLIPQTFYKMHKVSYYPPIKDDVELNCVPPPPSECVAGVYNLDMLLYPSDIQVAFPNINTTEESIKYKETIQKQHKFENTGMIVAGPPKEF